MDARETAALLLAVVSIAAIVAALLYATREMRGQRRAQNHGERLRRRKNADRIIAEREKPRSAS